MIGSRRLFSMSRESRWQDIPGKVRSVVICGPSGVGKGTLITRLLEKYPNAFALSVSHTSRSPRPGEIDGFHYHFRSLESIKQDIATGKVPFIEYAEVHGNLYGTSRNAVDSVLATGKVCVLDVDVHGVKQIKTTDLPAKYIFISPPSVQDLEKRLRNRNTESEESMKKRLGNAQREIEYGVGKDTNGNPNFDKILINDDIERAWKELVEILQVWFPSSFQAQS